MKTADTHKQIAVLGASGMVGTHLIAALQQRYPDHTLRAISRSQPLHHGDKNVDWIPTDLQDLQATQAALEGCEDVYIAAGILATAPVLARDPVAPVLGNLRLTTNALEAAWRNGAKRCVWLSSTTGYPAIEQELDEEDMFADNPPGNWYGLGWMTRYMETQCHWYAQCVPDPMKIAILRPSMIYGEHDDFDETSAHFLPSMIKRVVHGENPIEVWGSGEQTRDLIHAEDVAHAAIKAMETVETSAVWNIGAGHSVSVNDCLKQIIAIASAEDLQIVHRHDRPQTISKRRFSVEKAKRGLGFTPQISLEDGLRRTISWYRHIRDMSEAKA